jgi:hypothetical protein
MLEMLPKVYFASDGEIIMENLMSQSYSVLDRSIRHDLAQARYLKSLMIPYPEDTHRLAK